MCNGVGCNHCEGEGFFKLTKCGRQYVDRHIVSAVNLACQDDKGFLPVSGGLLVQSAWGVDLWITLSNEQNKIDADRNERR